MNHWKCPTIKNKRMQQRLQFLEYKKVKLDCLIQVLTEKYFILREEQPLFDNDSTIETRER